jgi:predicted XRE-type DNA-binding protein
MTKAPMVKGSGNVFRDLGFGEKKSVELVLKSGLLQSIQETIRERRLKQTEAAELLGIDQAKVSKLMAGQMAGFSLERLVYFVSRLGHDVELKIRTRPRPSRRAGRVSAKLAKAS